MTGRTLRIAVDAMGGDHAPEAIVNGALDAVRSLRAGGRDVEVQLFGPQAEVTRCLPGGAPPDGVVVVPATEVIGMAEEPAAAVRSKKDSSIVLAAQALRDGSADAMVGAGNTGATMAAALLRCGRIKGTARPAIAVPIPIPGAGRRQLLVDGGATTDPEPEWLAQWARLGRAYARIRLGVDEPSVGLLSNGEEPGKGDALRKAAYGLLEGVPGFRGNVEGRDLARLSTDVIVTDGFTGNVALKTIEGGLGALAGLVFSVLDEPEFAEVSGPIKLRMLERAADLLPDATGGALLLGVRGVCIISHGSSSALAIVNAIDVAVSCVDHGVVGAQEAALAG